MLLRPTTGYAIFKIQRGKPQAATLVIILSYCTIAVYTRPQKKHHKLMGTVTMIYWLTATAVFLLYTYGPHGNGQPRYSWIIWAVAGVLYAAVMGIVRIISRSRG